MLLAFQWWQLLVKASRGFIFLLNTLLHLTELSPNFIMLQDAMVKRNIYQINPLYSFIVGSWFSRSKSLTSNGRFIPHGSHWPVFTFLLWRALALTIRKQNTDHGTKQVAEWVRWSAILPDFSLTQFPQALQRPCCLNPTLQSFDNNKGSHWC